MRVIRRRRAWTLIEILIAVVLGSLLLGSILGVMVRTRFEEEVGARRLDALEAAQALIEQLSDDLQHLSPGGSADPVTWITWAEDGGAGELRFERWSDDPAVAVPFAVRYVVRPSSGDGDLAGSRIERHAEVPGEAPRTAVLVPGVLRACSLRPRLEMTDVTSTPAAASRRVTRLWLDLDARVETPALDGRATVLPLRTRITPRELNRGLRSHWI